MMRLSNAELINKLGSGDVGEAGKTFKIFRKYFLPHLTATVRKIVSNKDTVEDIVQDVFLLVWHLRLVLKDVDNVEAYFTRAAQNRAIDELGRISNYNLALSEYFLRTPHAEEPVSFDEPDEINIVRKLIEELPPRRRQVMRGLMIEGMTGKQIQEEMNISANSYRNYRRKASQQMQRKIDEMNKI
jgi:RNA polymerase sigma-70 factor, ECF subfamily